MADRRTTILLPGVFGAGYCDWGRKTPEEMIATIRSYAASQRAKAEAILAASDDDFRVYTHIGVHVERNREVLQEGKTND